jgi:hypothetical protein
MLNAWHNSLFAAGSDGLRASRIGSLRSNDPMQVVSGRIGRETLHFEMPPREGLETALQQLSHWFNNPPRDLDGLIRAGITHLWFVTLHPYDDSNGRLARALTDRALAQVDAHEVRIHHALTLSARIQQQRDGYYLQLERCQKGTLEITEWLLWFLEQLIAAAQQNGRVVNAVRAKALVLVEPPPHQLQSAPTQAAQSPPGCGTGRVRRRPHPAQGHRPHPHQPRHRLARPARAR